MDFKEYQLKSRETALYPDRDNNFIYPTLGLCGETGEVAEKIKKVLRDKGGVVSDETKIEIEKELGDILWYLAQICTELGLDFNQVADKNIAKLFSRKERGVLHGNGDNR